MVPEDELVAAWNLLGEPLLDGKAERVGEPVSDGVFDVEPLLDAEFDPDAV